MYDIGKRMTPEERVKYERKERIEMFIFILVIIGLCILIPWCVYDERKHKEQELKEREKELKEIVLPRAELPNIELEGYGEDEEGDKIRAKINKLRKELEALEKELNEGDKNE